MTPQEEKVMAEIKGTDLTYILRPCYMGWAIYKPLGNNRAKVLMTSDDREELRNFLKKAEVRYV